MRFNRSLHPDNHRGMARVIVDVITDRKSEIGNDCSTDVERLTASPKPKEDIMDHFLGMITRSCPAIRKVPQRVEICEINICQRLASRLGVGTSQCTQDSCGWLPGDRGLLSDLIRFGRDVRNRLLSRRGPATPRRASARISCSGCKSEDSREGKGEHRSSWRWLSFNLMTSPKVFSHSTHGEAERTRGCTRPRMTPRGQKAGAPERQSTPVLGSQ